MSTAYSPAMPDQANNSRIAAAFITLLPIYIRRSVSIRRAEGISPMANVTHLECSLCQLKYPADQVQHLCSCGGPLLVRYDLESLRRTWSPIDVRDGPDNMWRYAPVLPPRNESIVTLGEGMTPLLRARRLGARSGAQHLW